MFEFRCETECPHCNGENQSTASFNEYEFSETGGNSGPCFESCCECGKDYWFTSYLSFEVEVNDVFKKKPKPKSAREMKI